MEKWMHVCATFIEELAAQPRTAQRNPSEKKQTRLKGFLNRPLSLERRSPRARTLENLYPVRGRAQRIQCSSQTVEVTQGTRQDQRILQRCSQFLFLRAYGRNFVLDDVVFQHHVGNLETDHETDSLLLACCGPSCATGPGHLACG